MPNSDDSVVIIRMEAKMDSLITQQHFISQRMAQQAGEMKVRLEEYEKRLDRHYMEIVHPLEKKVESLVDKQNEIVNDLREISRNLSDVCKIVDQNSKNLTDVRMTRARAAGVLAGITAFVTAVSAIASSAVRALMGG